MSIAGACIRILTAPLSLLDNLTCPIPLWFEFEPDDGELQTWRSSASPDHQTPPLLDEATE
jgi:hypothetical protein